MSGQIVAILVVFIVIGLPIICRTLIVLSREMRKGQTAEEAETVQELNNLLSRLEKRIDTLETIILDREKSRREETR